MKRLSCFLILFVLTMPVYAQDTPYMLSQEGEIIDVEISPVPVFPDEKVYLEITVRNTGRLNWSAGDYIVYADLYDANKSLVERTAEVRGKSTIPSGTSELLVLHFKSPKAGNYSIKAGVILTEDITQIRKELIESRYHDFYVDLKRKKVKVSGNFATENEYITLTGNKEGPFVTEGFNTVNNLSLRIDYDISDDKRLEGFLHTKATDNPLIDTKTVSFEEVYINYFSEQFNVKLGDFYQEFSDYTISKNLEGVSSEIKLNRFKIMPFFGREWEAENEIQYTRYVYGVRPEYKIMENSWIRDFTVGFNYVSTQDDSGSLESEHEENVSDLDNHVYSVDTRLAFNNGLEFETEYAGSRNDEDVKDNEKARSGNAFRFTSRYMSEKLWLLGKYIRVNSRFDNPAGFAVQDREEYFARGICKITTWLSIKPLYRQYRDNLDKSKSTTTKVKTPELTLTINPIKSWEDLSIDLSQRKRYRKSADESTYERWVTNEVVLNNRIWKTYFDLGYSQRKIKDKTDAENDSATQIISLGVRSLLEYRDLTITPSLRYSRENEKLRVSNNKDITNSVTLGLNFSLYPFNLDLYHTFFDSDRYTDDSDYRRNRSDIRLKYRIGGSWDKVVTIGYELVDYNHEDNDSDYSEKRVYAKLDFRF